MSDTKILRDKLMNRLVVIVDEDELSPSMVSAVVNFLKTFPPHEELEDLPTAKKIADSLKKYQNVMPFDKKEAH